MFDMRMGSTFDVHQRPSPQIAVLKEVEGKGPFCSLVMAVVVVKDVVVIVAFALNIELIRAVSHFMSRASLAYDPRSAGP